MVQPVKLSTTVLLSIESLHNGSRSNSQNCTKRSVWISANGFWIVMVLKVTIFWKELSQEMKYGSTITSQRVNARVWNGNIIICQPRKSTKCIQPQEGLCLQFLGFTRATTGTLSREVLHSEQCSLWWDAVWQTKACSLRQTKRTAVRRCVVLALTLLPTLLKLNFEVLEYPPYSPDLAASITCLVHLNKAWTMVHRLKETVHAWLVP